MVVVVVLGILAGIAVQRMSDVRDRAEEAAKEANIRLLVGTANLAITRNYEDYMYYYIGTGGTYPLPHQRDGVIRWVRPCEQSPVTQFITQAGSLYIGYDYIDPFAHPLGHWDWTPGQEWNLMDYLESFPVGYAVEIIFAARDEHGDIHEDPNMASAHGFSGEQVDYDKDHIMIYKFKGDVDDSNYWDDWNPLSPSGPEPNYQNIDGHTIIGFEYPYYGLSHEDWDQVYPDN